MNVTDFAYKTGAKVIALTDSKLSPLSAISDLCFDIKEGEVMGFRSLTSSMTLAQTLLVGLAYRLNSDGMLSDTNTTPWNK